MKSEIKDTIIIILKQYFTEQLYANYCKNVGEVSSNHIENFYQWDNKDPKVIKECIDAMNEVITDEEM